MLIHNSMPARRLALLFAPLLALVGVLTGVSAAANGKTGAGARPTIVLVHGDWADASSWNSVVKRLQDGGFAVVAPPNLLRGPSVDAGYLADYLKSISGPIVLVAHSYGGVVITNAATGNPNVKALVYIDSFLPDDGEVLGALTATWGSCVGESALNPVPYDGGVDLYLRWDASGSYGGYTQCFANGVAPKEAAALFAEQRPAAAAEFAEASGRPAWKTIPSWSLIGTLDHVIPPAWQEQMSERAGANITKVKAGHLSLITRPADVTKVILSAVNATT
jgi:pimeloyl-ACP methyl ester carboxylesterase